MRSGVQGRFRTTSTVASVASSPVRNFDSISGGSVPERAGALDVAAPDEIQVDAKWKAKGGKGYPISMLESLQTVFSTSPRGGLRLRRAGVEPATIGLEIRGSIR